MGKTTFAAKSPNPLILDFEAGTLSVRDFDLAVSNPRTIDAVIKTIKKAERAGISTMIIDSETEMARAFMNGIMEDMSAKDPRKDLFSPTLEAWGKLTEQMRYVVRAARDAQMHTVFVCLESVDKDETSGFITYAPALSPKIQSDTCAYVDIIGRLSMRKDKRVCSFEPSDRQIAKDRSGVLPAQIVSKGKDDPDFSINYIIRRVETITAGQQPDEIEEGNQAVEPND